MSKLKVFLDMDGVICDFHSRYQQIKGNPKWCDVTYHKLVLEHRIFSNLDWMPNGKKLAEYLLSKYESGIIDLEILSSCGTWNVQVAPHSAEQKTHWLNARGFSQVKKNFVHSFACKKNYATPNSLLIDDRLDCHTEFIGAGGMSILYNDHHATDALMKLEEVIDRR